VGPPQLHAPGHRHAPHVITITTTAKFTCSVNFLLTGSAHHRSRSEGTLRRFLSPLTHHHHDATVRQHQSARPSPIPHRMRDRTMTPSSRRLREQIPKVWGYGSWRRQAAGHGNARRGGPGDPKYNHVMKREELDATKPPSRQSGDRQRTASRHRLDVDDGLASRSLRPLEHQLQCHTGRRARVRELQFLVGNRRDDPALIGRSDEIWNRTRLDV